MTQSKSTTLLVLIILTITLTIGGFIYIKIVDTHYVELKQKTNTEIQLLASTTASLSQSIKLIQENLSENQNFNNALTVSLAEEQQRANTFQSQLQQVSGTVGTLDKLSKTDKELLEKYSKVYFLNEHYVPSSVSEIGSVYLYSITRPLKFHTQALPHLTRMIDDALTASTTLYVKSAYRSFYEQASLKSAYTMTYGAGTANSFSADQGYSEHQLGTTVDLTTLGLGGELVGFDKKPAFTWMQENAYKYGFILSYPKNNGYYIYEPWHWRYVGVALATKLYNEGTTFYNTDQRVIDSYLISIFD